MTGRELRKAMHDGRRIFGTCVTVCQPGWAELVASTGVDFVFIDSEHMPLGRPELAWMCRAFKALNVAPIVRVPKPDPYWGCMAFDAGATGVVFPYVETVAETEALRGASKLRPLKGASLKSALDDIASLNAETQKYLGDRNASSLMIVNIESQAAIDELDGILAVPGLDALLIGPHDLSINLGVPEQYGSDKFLDAVSTIILKARERHVGAGIHWSGDVDQHISWTRHGGNFVVHSTDAVLMREAVASKVRTFKEALGETSGTKTNPENEAPEV
jgi:4-hydroxy-2-oxoheptanedioate aldolase